MSSDLLISLEDVSKRFEMYSNPRDRLLQMLFRGHRQFFHEFWALQHISFTLSRGESVGILGRNGAGKSTLLQIIAGVLSPTSGKVNVNGRVAALLELGSGFNPEFTGRENAYMNGAILGLTRQEMEAAMPEIERFAGVGEFFDQPVKLYSSGMMVRVAFAVQVQLKPDILIVDEALAVGDALFQKRCYQRIRELLDGGTSLLFVTHDMEAVRTFTQHALLLEHGTPLTYGPSSEVLTQYRQLLLQEEKSYLRQEVRRQQAENRVNEAPAVEQSVAPAVKEEGSETSPSQNSPNSHKSNPAQVEGKAAFSREIGNKEAEITRVVLCNDAGSEENIFFPGDVIKIGITFRTKKDIDNLYIGVRIRNKEGVKIYSWGTFNQDMTLRELRSKQGKQSSSWDKFGGISSEKKSDSFLFWEYTFKKDVDYTVWLECLCCNLGQNFYEVEAYILQQTALNFQSQIIFHWLNEAAFFHVQTRNPEYFFGGTCDMRMHAYLEGEDAK